MCLTLTYTCAIILFLVLIMVFHFIYHKSRFILMGICTVKFIRSISPLNGKGFVS